MGLVHGRYCVQACERTLCGEQLCVACMSPLGLTPDLTDVGRSWSRSLSALDVPFS